MDIRQKEIFHAWFKLGIENADKPYIGFMSLWIAFNAYCYANYHKKANQLLARMRDKDGFKNISDARVEITEGLVSECNGKYTIDIKQPGRIKLVVEERFTESIIYDSFAKEFKEVYIQMLQQKDFAEAINTLREALRKANHGFYVVNMSNISKYNIEIPYKDLVAKNIIAPLEEIDDIIQLKNVLYQIRCNIFHAEKLPGLINDDKIVKAAYPVLLAILIALQPVND